MTTSGLSFVTVDVFTEQRFGGNPLAIVLVPEDCSPSQEEKQAVAKEYNLSESVFLHLSKKSTETAEWKYDIFVTEYVDPNASDSIELT
jgi:PhzF family phenazine biosynthesis protein